MKKIIAAFCLLLAAGTAQVFSYGVGIQGGYGFGRGGAGAVTFKLDELPYVFAVSISGGEEVFISGTADYWFKTDTLYGPARYFVGAGAGLAIGTGDEFFLGAAFRVPVGINAFLVDNFVEPYIQIVPELGLSVLPYVNMTWDVGANIGVRFWF